MSELKILVTNEADGVLFSALTDGRLTYLTHTAAQPGGGIFVGRIEHNVSNLRAAFVRFRGDENGYLSYDDVPSGALVNRSYVTGDSLRAGDLIPVQIVRTAQGMKQARLTGMLTLSASYTVLVYGRKGIGCSGRMDAQQKKQLKALLQEAVSAAAECFPADFLTQHGVILRTEAATLPADRDATSVRKTLLNELYDLSRQMTDIRTRAGKHDTGTRLYLADENRLFEEQITRLYHFFQAAEQETAPAVSVVCETPALCDTVRTLPLLLAHDEITPVLHEDTYGASMHAVYGLKSKLDALAQRIVHLKSGAFLVIDATEAMTVIDVNSGKNTGGTKGSFLQINLEAATESLRQIRLRDIRGIIMIDFINLSSGEDRHALGEHLNALAAADPVHTKFVDFTALGLAELTRSGIQ